LRSATEHWRDSSGEPLMSQIDDGDDGVARIV
jgi:hypothetical protein